MTVTAKMVLFSGYAVGTILAGFVSDYMGRKAAIAFFSQLLFGTGIIATVMPNATGFIVMWFFVGKWYIITTDNFGGPRNTHTDRHREPTDRSN